MDSTIICFSMWKFQKWHHNIFKLRFNRRKWLLQSLSCICLNWKIHSRFSFKVFLNSCLTVWALPSWLAGRSCCGLWHNSCLLARLSLSHLHNWRYSLLTEIIVSTLKKTHIDADLISSEVMFFFSPDSHRSLETGSHYPLLLEPTRSAPQSGLRKHRWMLILSWLFHITAERFEFILGHIRNRAKIPFRVWDQASGIDQICLYISVPALHRVYVCSKRRGTSQVCVLQLVLWIRPMTDTSYKPAISQHQGGTAPLPTRPRTRCQRPHTMKTAIKAIIRVSLIIHPINDHCMYAGIPADKFC